jgi:hypothetical protein
MQAELTRRAADGAAEGPEGSRPVTPGEDAICKRTRSTHPMTDISLDELEAILNPLPGKLPARARRSRVCSWL